MEITKTTIRASLHALVADRMYCMNNGKIEKRYKLVSICNTLLRELEWHRKHGHNAHTAIVRNNAHGIIVLASTLGRKHKKGQEIMEMVQTLTNK